MSHHPARIILAIKPVAKLLAVTARGRVALIRWEFAGQQPGSLERFLPTALQGDPVVSVLQLPDVEGDSNKAAQSSLGLLSSDGRFKRLPMKELLDLSGRAASVVKLKEGVELKTAVICQEGGTLSLISDLGRILRLPVTDNNLPLMGKLAQGPVTMRLLPEESLIAAVATDPNQQDPLLLFSRQGTIKSLPLDGVRLCQRGDLGVIGWQSEQDGSEREDRLCAACVGSGLVGIVTSSGRHGRLLAHEPIHLPLKSGETLERIVPLLS